MARRTTRFAFAFAFQILAHISFLIIYHKIAVSVDTSESLNQSQNEYFLILIRDPCVSYKRQLH